jgi:predicted small lipoprotein YifL
MKKVIYLLSIVLMLISLLGCGTTNVPTKVTSSTPSASDQTTPKIETFKIGDTFKLGDLQYKVNGVRTSRGANEYMKPKDGNTFLLIEITIENQGNKDAAISSMLSFSLVDKDGRSQEYSIGAMTGAKGKLDGSIPPTRKMTGELGYEVSTNSQAFELQIKNDILSNGTAIVSIPVK